MMQDHPDIYVRIWIDRALEETGLDDPKDPQVAAKLREWRNKAHSNYESGVQITAVTLAGESQSGEITVNSERMLQQLQAAIEWVEKDRDALSGVGNVRWKGYVTT